MGLTIRRRFDEAAATTLYGVGTAELRERFAEVTVRGWWFASDDRGEPIGLALATVRPDGRVFVTHRLASESAFAPLLTEALADIDGPVHVTVRSDQTDRAACAWSLGLREELSSAGYHVPFDRALSILPTPRPNADARIAAVTDVDPDRLYALDLELRNDTPGNDGWQGNRAWFDDELKGPECDPSGYLVAVDGRDSELIGLCRIWRNPEGPALGMLGVRQDRRQGFVAVRLLRETLVNASTWGWPTFSTHTARPGLQRHLVRAGATTDDGFLRFGRP